MAAENMGCRVGGSTSILLPSMKKNRFWLPPYRGSLREGIVARACRCALLGPCFGSVPGSRAPRPHSKGPVSRSQYKPVFESFALPP